MKEVEGSPVAAAEGVVRPVVFDIHGRLAESFRVMEQMLEELKHHQDARVRLAAAAEMRHHIALASKTLEIAMRADALRVFQAGVLEALAEAGVTVRRQIIGMFEARMKDEG